MSSAQIGGVTTRRQLDHEQGKQMTDLDRLDTYLSSDSSPPKSILLSDLNGFLSGILCAPELIMPSEWLPVVWGSSEPDVDDLDEHIWANQAVLGRYNEIAGMLNSDPGYLEPIFWQSPEGHSIAMDWCEGFNDAVQLRKQEWQSFVNTKQGSRWTYPIRAHLFDENGVSQSGVSEQELDSVLDECAKRIPVVVPLIFNHWQKKRH